MMPDDAMVEAAAKAIEREEAAYATDATGRLSEQLARAALSTIDREAIRGGWQPMETAPKDGTQILAYSKDAVGIGKYCDNWWDADGNPVLPTHWMPLPAPPGATTPPTPDPRDAEIARLREALERCAETFQTYAALHWTKRNPEADKKAVANADLERMCRAALETGPDGGEAG